MIIAQKVDMGSILLVLLSVASASSLSSLEMVVKEMAQLEDRMAVQHRGIRDNSGKAKQVMDLMLGFEDKRILKESQTYIKEFLNVDEEDKPKKYDERVKRSVGTAQDMFKNFDVVGVDSVPIYTENSVTDSDLKSLSGMVEVQNVENTDPKVPCWLLRNTVHCLVGDDAVTAVLPDTGLPVMMDGSLTFNRVLLSADTNTVYVFQTRFYKNNPDRDPFTLHIVYEFSFTTASTPPSITPLLKTWVEYTPLIICSLHVQQVGYSVVLATDGIFFTAFDACAGLKLYFYSFVDETLALVTSSSIEDSIFNTHDALTGIKQVILFNMESVNYLAIARAKKCLLYEFVNSGKTSKLSLKQKFKRTADTVKFFKNSFGSYLVFVEKTGFTGLGSTYLLASGEFVLMQDKQKWGAFRGGKNDISSYGLVTGGEFLLPEQELVFIAYHNKFLKFTAPGILVEAKTLSLTPPVGYNIIIGLGITGSTSGAASWLVTMCLEDMNSFFYFGGGSMMAIYTLNVEADEGVSYTNLGDLASSVLELEKNVEADEKTLASLSGALDMIKLDADVTNTELVVTAQNITISGTLDVASIEITVEHGTTSIPTFATIDYNDDTSDISVATLQSTTDAADSEYIYKNSILKSGPSPITLQSSGSITAPSVTTYKADVAKLDSTLVKGRSSFFDQDVVTFLTKSLRTTGPQTLAMDISFDKVIVSGATEFQTATAVNKFCTAIEPQKMIDTQEANVLPGLVKFTELHFTMAPVFEATINTIALGDIITRANAETATSDDPIMIYGDKTLSGGVTAEGIITIIKINDQEASAVLNPKLMDKGEENSVQTFSCSSFFFNDIQVRTNLDMPTFGSAKHDVRVKVLSDIVVKDSDNGAITGSNIFLGTVVVNELETVTINDEDPSEFLISGQVQDIQSPIKAAKLVTSNLVTDNLNYVDLGSDVARTDQENVFTAEITFTDDFAVGTSAAMDDDVTIDGVDVSSLGETGQEYQGVVTITGNLVIDNADISVSTMDFGEETNVPVDKPTFDDNFLYKDTSQELEVQQFEGSVVNFDQVSLLATLDGFDLKTDVVHTSGDETILLEGITFQAETKFKSDLEVVAERPTIGDVDIMTLQDQIYCPAEVATVTFGGIKTLAQADSADAEVTSFFDVTGVQEFSANGKDFMKFEDNVADLGGSNTFGGEITFAHPSSGTTEVDVSVNFALSSASHHLSAADSATVLLNGKNLEDFESKIVKKTSGESFAVTTHVEFGHLTVSTGVLNAGGTIDGENPVDYLDVRVLLDCSSDLNVELTSPTIEFKEGLTMEPESSVTYFAGLDLVAYKDSLFVRGEGEVGGLKTFAAGQTLNVVGDLSFGENILPFDVDLSTLSATGLKISADQTIDVEYTIDSISKVEKIYSEKIAETIVDDICLTDGDCAITCPVESPCATFLKTVTAEDGIDIEGTLEGIDMSTVIAKLASNDNEYNLDVLDVPSGGFTWTNDDSFTANTVSDLYSNLVVKSGKDWSTGVEAEVVQEITGDVEFVNTVSFNDVTLDSGNINVAAESLVNPGAIILDSATKAGNNIFTESKTFQADVRANTATVASLSSVNEINDLIVADYRADVLLVGEEISGEVPFEQEVTGEWTMLNGVVVFDTLSVGGAVDGVEVEDLVRKDVIDVKEIPAVTFDEKASVTGNIVATGTDFQTRLDDFFADTIKTDDDTTISQNLKFTGSVLISSDVTVTKLNNIPSNTWVETVTGNTEQVITADKIFAEDVAVKGNVISDDIADTDLGAKYADALKVDEGAVITGPSVEFSATTTLLTEKLVAPMEDLIDSLIDDFVIKVGNFVDELYAYYKNNIISVLPSFLREVEVAKQLDLGKLRYLEEQTVPAYLDMELHQEDIEKKAVVAVTAVEMDESLYSLSFVANSTSCGLSSPCFCQESGLASSLDQSGLPTSLAEDRTFFFSLSVGLFNVSSKVDSYSDECSVVDETSGLIVTGILTNTAAASANLDLLSLAMVGINLVPQDLNLINDAEVGYVNDMEMWELGNMVYLAVATTYKMPKYKIQLYKMDVSAEETIWEDAGKIEAEDGEDLGPVSSLEVVKFTDRTENPDGAIVEKVHLFAGRIVSQKFWGQSMNDIWVYEMSMTAGAISPSNGISFQQRIAAPGLVGMEVLVYNDGAFEESEVLLIVATNVKLNYGPDTATVSTFVFDTVNNIYKVALLPDTIQVVGDHLVKMVSVKIARHTVVFLAETDKMSVYRYVPFQGLRLLDSLVAKNILDFTVYSHWGKKGEQAMVYMLMEGPKSMLYELKVSGTVPTVKLSFKHYQA